MGNAENLTRRHSNPGLVWSLSVGALMDIDTRIALQEAAEVVKYLRCLIEHSGARTERGIDIAIQVTPLLTRVADDADEVIVRLVEWAEYWAEKLGVRWELGSLWMRVDEDSPASSPRKEYLGFRAGTSPEAAARIVKQVTSWFFEHNAKIEQHNAVGEFQKDVSELVSKMHLRYKLTRSEFFPQQQQIQERPCPVCGVLAVMPVHRSGGMTIECHHCRYIPAPYPAGIVRRLGDSSETQVLSPHCELFEHESCVGVHCVCRCHQTVSNK